jgi:hypothetical protein
MGRYALHCNPSNSTTLSETRYIVSSRTLHYITKLYCLINILYVGFSVSSFQGYPISHKNLSRLASYKCPLSVHALSYSHHSVVTHLSSRTLNRRQNLRHITSIVPVMEQTDIQPWLQRRQKLVQSALPFRKLESEQALVRSVAAPSHEIANVALGQLVAAEIGGSHAFLR